MIEDNSKKRKHCAPAMPLVALLALQMLLSQGGGQFGAKQGLLRTLQDAAAMTSDAAAIGGPLTTKEAMVKVAGQNSGRVICVISNAAVTPVLGMHLVC